ncbi:hypothetical protein LTR36_004637 [Oleoguttula mirabilis]|uniref:Uncharacterized protein n=1 Tax=Oleoguttula mirabilis TaxID=1507867 RepID=A0AAV9JH39_9PEZI|nr:hypothetical protein LTR36_004637 [Oleoguttula mirabilis]
MKRSEYDRTPVDLLREYWPYASPSCVNRPDYATWSSKPALLDVCQQVRHESSIVYFKINRFRMWIDTPSPEYDDPLDEVVRWAAQAPAEALKYLRDLSLWVHRHYALSAWIHVSYEPATGLSVKVDAHYRIVSEFERSRDPVAAREKERRYDEYKAREDEYCKMIERRRVDEGWETSGVLEFFTADRKTFHSALCGPPRKWDESRYEMVLCDEGDPETASRWAPGERYRWPLKQEEELNGN